MLKQLLQHAVQMKPPAQWPTFDGKVLDRTEFLTSSEVASCLRQTYFSKVPGKAVFRGNGYTERGNAIEDWFVETITQLTPLGYKFEYVGDGQRSFYDAENGLSGTPDGLMTTPEGDKYLLEIKSIDPRFNKRNLPKKPHVYQIQQNMYLVQKCLNCTLRGGILFYIDASNIYDVNEFEYTYDPKMISVCFNRADNLWSAKGPDDLEPEGIQTGECETCAFTNECSATITMQKALAEAGAKAVPFSASQLPEEVGYSSLSDEEKTLLATYLDAYHAAKKAGKIADEKKQAVNQLVVKRNGLVAFGEYVLTAATYAGRETIDKTALAGELAKFGLSLDKYMKRGAPYVMLNVKEPKT